MVQMLGWFKADAARASRWKRSRDCESLAKSSGKNFSATKRPSLVSWALYTTPIPSPPSFSMMRYWPRVSPIIAGFCGGIVSVGKRRVKELVFQELVFQMDDSELAGG